MDTTTDNPNVPLSPRSPGIDKDDDNMRMSVDTDEKNVKFSTGTRELTPHTDDSDSTGHEEKKVSADNCMFPPASGAWLGPGWLVIWMEVDGFS